MIGDIYIYIYIFFFLEMGSLMTSSSSAGPIQISKFPEPCVTRNFFEISHGKSVCDGLGATVKNVCYRAVVSGKKVISDASDVFNFCEEKLKRENTEGAEVTISRRDFISLTDVERNRNESEVQTLNGTRKLHAVRSTGTNYILDTRNLSCYCDSCINNQGDCENREFVCQWERKSLRTVEEKSKQNTDKNSAEGVIAPAGAKVTGATIRTWLLNKFISFLAVLIWKTGLKKM